MNAHLEQWDLDVLKYFAEDIETASRTHPRSWALKASETSLVLTVHQWNVLKLGKRTCECWLPGNPNDQRFAFPYARPEQIKHRSGKKGFWVLKLAPPELLMLLNTTYDQHQEDIPRIAKQVTSNCRDWDQHDQEVQDELARLTNVHLPRPGYLR